MWPRAIWLILHLTIQNKLLHMQKNTNKLVRVPLTTLPYIAKYFPLPQLGEQPLNTHTTNHAHRCIPAALRSIFPNWDHCVYTALVATPHSSPLRIIITDLHLKKAYVEWLVLQRGLGEVVTIAAVRFVVVAGVCSGGRKRPYRWPFWEHH